MLFGSTTLVSGFDSRLIALATVGRSNSTGCGNPPVTAVTVSVMVSLSLSWGVPLSITVNVRLVSPTWPAVGVQLNTPVVALNVASVGKALLLKTRPFAGRSGSVAVTVKVTVCPTCTVLLPIAPSTGA